MFQNELAETYNNAEVKEEHVTIAVPNQHDVVDDESKMKRRRKTKTRWKIDDGVGDEDEVDDENEVDDEDDWN
ncbi:hypothetical protein Tco_1240442 [Tanacetum coccineum]